MKNTTRLFISMFAGAMALPLAQADQSKELRVLAQAGQPEDKITRRIVIQHDGEAGAKESVAFLGVETTPVPPVLTAQLALPKGAGLVVRHVVPDSPAAAALQVHDVLLKLDDQLLIEPRQFSVLVRNHKEGDEVTLTYLRGGKEATAKVKLAKHDVPKLALLGGGEGESGMFDALMDNPDGMPALPREEMNRVLSLLDRHQSGAPRHRVQVQGHNPGPGFNWVQVNPGNSNMVFSDEKGSLELTIKDGKKTLLAKNPKGDQVFSGAVDTPEQRQAMPGEVRARLDEIEAMREFTFQTDADFKGDVLPPSGRKIVAPLPPRPEWAREQRPAAF